MRHLLSVALLIFTTSAFAHGPQHPGNWRHHGYYNHDWVTPVIIGGVIGYGLSRYQQPVIVQQVPPPVVVQQQQNCGPWTQIQQPDGTTTITRTCYGIQ